MNPFDFYYVILLEAVWLDRLGVVGRRRDLVRHFLDVEFLW
jgi:hypothetical protein